MSSSGDESGGQTMKIRTILAAIVLVASFTAQNVTLVYWQLPDTPITSYGVLLQCGFCFAGMFVLCALGFASATGDWSVFKVSDDPAECRLLFWPFRDGFRSGRLTHAQLLCTVGVLNSLNEVFVVYASPPERTPPLISSVLQNSNVIFSVPFAKWWLGDRKRYVDKEPMFAATLIVCSVLVSLTPTLLRMLAGKSDDDGDDMDPEDKVDGSQGPVFWAGIYILGLIPNALMNTLQQLYFLRVDPMGDMNMSAHDEWKTFFRALLAAQVAQMCAYPFLFWVDLIPSFGFSHSMKDLGHGTMASLACSFGVSSDPKCDPTIPFFAFAFILANLTGYLSCALVNKESATFNMLCMVLVTSCTSVIWEIPGAQPDSASGTTRLYSVLTSLCLCFVGSGLWKRWEVRTPTTEQFAICAVLKDRNDCAKMGDMAKMIPNDPFYDPRTKSDGSDGFDETGGASPMVFEDDKSRLSGTVALKKPRSMSQGSGASGFSATSGGYADDNANPFLKGRTLSSPLTAHLAPGGQGQAYAADDLEEQLEANALLAHNSQVAANKAATKGSGHAQGRK